MSLKLDMRDFEKLTRQLGAFESQIPFALANAMTSAAFIVRQQLIDDTWSRGVEVRNRNALRQALRVEKARKRDLRVAIVGSGPSAERLNLKAHAEAGGKAHAHRRLAIPPSGTVRRGARGVPKGQQPRAIIANTPKRALRITDRGIFVGKGGRLHLKYAFTPSAQIPADVPFYQDFDRMMSAQIKRSFVTSMNKAMRTAFRD